MNYLRIIGFLIMAGSPTCLFPQGDTLNQLDSRGRKTGYWIQHFPGTVALQYEGLFYEGHPVGAFKRYYAEGGLKALMNYDSTGANVEVKFYDPVQHLRAWGHYRNQMKTGEWVYYSDRMIPLFTIPYSGDNIHGEALRFDAEGKLDEKTQWSNGVMDGHRITYYPDGREQSRLQYREGKMDGGYLFFSETGQQLIVGWHTTDLKDSTWLYYDDTGKRIFELRYDHGKLLNGAQLNEKEQELFRLYDENRKLLKDPADYIRNPEEYFRR